MRNLPKKVRGRKLNSRVDLTAMVSVSFLLIIFFMVSAELRKPKMMDLNSSDNGCCDCPYRHPGENRSVTILLGENNKLVYFIGLVANPIKEPQIITYGKDGIRKELLERQKSSLDYSKKSGHSEGISVIIKPSKKSNYGNLVDIIDEMNITGINSYEIVNDFTPEETKLLASN
ncbi:ExbD/TolR family protein [Flavobacterium ajazii]|uniref:ExbD/TolR family protein n=1 Tax=Flavobacterium ajazii TaxID=2692318 RepID=UPI0013D1AC17|nr:biopolymer transporter ExbD [Flavobacterium ajazii]